MATTRRKLTPWLGKVLQLELGIEWLREKMREEKENPRADTATDGKKFTDIYADDGTNLRILVTRDAFADNRVQIIAVLSITHPLRLTVSDGRTQINAIVSEEAATRFTQQYHKEIHHHTRYGVISIPKFEVVAGHIGPRDEQVHLLLHEVEWNGHPYGPTALHSTKQITDRAVVKKLLKDLERLRRKEDNDNDSDESETNSAEDREFLDATQSEWAGESLPNSQLSSYRLESPESVRIKVEDADAEEDSRLLSDPFFPQEDAQGDDITLDLASQVPFSTQLPVGPDDTSNQSRQPPRSGTSMENPNHANSNSRDLLLGLLSKKSNVPSFFGAAHPTPSNDEATKTLGGHKDTAGAASTASGSAGTFHVEADVMGRRAHDQPEAVEDSEKKDTNKPLEGRNGMPGITNNFGSEMANFTTSVDDDDDHDDFHDCVESQIIPTQIASPLDLVTDNSITVETNEPLNTVRKVIAEGQHHSVPISSLMEESPISEKSRSPLPEEPPGDQPVPVILPKSNIQKPNFKVKRKDPSRAFPSWQPFPITKDLVTIPQHQPTLRVSAIPQQQFSPNPKAEVTTSDNSHKAPESSTAHEDWVPFPVTSDLVAPLNSPSEPTLTHLTLHESTKRKHDNNVPQLPWAPFSITRALVTVPKTQKRLIDRPETWLPPPPGHRFPSSNIPLEILNEICFAARQRSVTSTDEDTENNLESSPEQSSDEKTSSENKPMPWTEKSQSHSPHRQRGSASHQKLNSSHDCSEASDEGNNTNDDEDFEWSQSPLRETEENISRTFLPPDSSIPKPSPPPSESDAVTSGMVASSWSPVWEKEASPIDANALSDQLDSTPGTTVGINQTVDSGYQASRGIAKGRGDSVSSSTPAGDEYGKKYTEPETDRSLSLPTIHSSLPDVTCGDEQERPAGTVIRTRSKEANSPPSSPSEINVSVEKQGHKPTTSAETGNGRPPVPAPASVDGLSEHIDSDDDDDDDMEVQWVHTTDEMGGLAQASTEEHLPPPIIVLVEQSPRDPNAKDKVSSSRAMGRSEITSSVSRVPDSIEIKAQHSRPNVTETPMLCKSSEAAIQIDEVHEPSPHEALTIGTMNESVVPRKRGQGHTTPSPDHTKIRKPLRPSYPSGRGKSVEEAMADAHRRKREFLANRKKEVSAKLDNGALEASKSGGSRQFLDRTSPSWGNSVATQSLISPQAGTQAQALQSPILTPETYKEVIDLTLGREEMSGYDMSQVGPPTNPPLTRKGNPQEWGTTVPVSLRMNGPFYQGSSGSHGGSADLSDQFYPTIASSPSLNHPPPHVPSSLVTYTPTLPSSSGDSGQRGAFQVRSVEEAATSSLPAHSLRQPETIDLTSDSNEATTSGPTMNITGDMVSTGNNANGTMPHSRDTPEWSASRRSFPRGLTAGKSPNHGLRFENVKPNRPSITGPSLSHAITDRSSIEEAIPVEASSQQVSQTGTTLNRAVKGKGRNDQALVNDGHSLKQSSNQILPSIPSTSRYSGDGNFRPDALATAELSNKPSSKITWPMKLPATTPAKPKPKFILPSFEGRSYFFKAGRSEPPPLPKIPPHLEVQKSVPPVEDHSINHPFREFVTGLASLKSVGGTLGTVETRTETVLNRRGKLQKVEMEFLQPPPLLKYDALDPQFWPRIESGKKGGGKRKEAETRDEPMPTARAQQVEAKKKMSEDQPKAYEGKGKRME